jgi:hypothetical protein
MAFGGSYNKDYIKESEFYDPAKNVWEKLKLCNLRPFTNI